MHTRTQTTRLSDNEASESPDTTREMRVCQLEKLLDSPAKKGLLRYFCQNRYAMDTVEGLSLWTGFPKDSLTCAAKTLVDAGLLERIGEGEDAVYVFNGGPGVDQNDVSNDLYSLVSSYFEGQC